MMDMLAVDEEIPQGSSPGQTDMLRSIFSSLPYEKQLDALSSIGVQVRDPQTHLPSDMGQNDIKPWNSRRIEMTGRDSRPPVWDKSKVIEVPLAMTRGAEPDYLSPNADEQNGALSQLYMGTGGA